MFAILVGCFLRLLIVGPIYLFRALVHIVEFVARLMVPAGFVAQAACGFFWSSEPLVLTRKQVDTFGVICFLSAMIFFAALMVVWSVTRTWLWARWTRNPNLTVGHIGFLVDFCLCAIPINRFYTTSKRNRVFGVVG